MTHVHHLNDLLGYVASALVLITFSARSITTLRIVAITSNVMFIAYAVSAQLPPVLLLHLLLLPLNAWRLVQAMRSRRTLRPAPPERSTTFAPGGTR
jgi:hypothetical protein